MATRKSARKSQKSSSSVADDDAIHAFLLRGDPHLATQFGFAKNMKIVDLDDPMSAALAGLKKGFEKGELTAPLDPMTFKNKKAKNQPTEEYLSDQTVKDFILSTKHKGSVNVNILEKEEEEPVVESTEKRQSSRMKEKRNTEPSTSGSTTRTRQNAEEKPFKIPRKA